MNTVIAYLGNKKLVKYVVSYVFLGGVNILKPPNSVVSENLFMAILGHFPLEFVVKFGHKTPYDIS